MTRHAYRFFAESVAGGVALLGLRERRHLEQVLRMRVGDTCEVAAGGRAYHARVAPGGLELMEEIDVVSAPPVTVWLAQPGGRSDSARAQLSRVQSSRKSRRVRQSPTCHAASTQPASEVPDL